mgnify:CR=1 FL=1
MIGILTGLLGSHPRNHIPFPSQLHLLFQAVTAQEAQEAADRIISLKSLLDLEVQFLGVTAPGVGALCTNTVPALSIGSLFLNFQV